MMQLSEKQAQKTCLEMVEWSCRLRVRVSVSEDVDGVGSISNSVCAEFGVSGSPEDDEAVRFRRSR